MNLKKILYPTDFSHQSHEVLAVATSLARGSSAKLIICHVFQPAEPVNAMVSHSSRPTELAEQTQILHNIRPLDPAVSYEHRIIDGSPSDGILKLAESEDIDLIVMGTHGRTGLKRLLMGSVAEQVVRAAPCPVLTLRQPNETPAA